jgi:predicted MFS family arabinose efflux permease
MISSSRSTLYRFLSLYAALYAGFGVQSSYLPILLDNRHLSPQTIALALAAGTAMRLTAAPAVARLADRFDAPKAMLALCSAAAGLIGLRYLPAQEAWALIALGVVRTAALAPLPPLSDTLALGAAAPTGSGGMPKPEVPVKVREWIGLVDLNNAPLAPETRRRGAPADRVVTKTANLSQGV